MPDTPCLSHGTTNSRCINVVPLRLLHGKRNSRCRKTGMGQAAAPVPRCSAVVNPPSCQSPPPCRLPNHFGGAAHGFGQLMGQAAAARHVEASRRLHPRKHLPALHLLLPTRGDAWLLTAWAEGCAVLLQPQGCAGANQRQLAVHQAAARRRSRLASTDQHRPSDATSETKQVRVRAPPHS
jgi:hypothetical protein